MLGWLAVAALQLDQPPNTWVKRSPLEDTPVSPRLGYEGDCVWYAKRRVLLRYGGHNQGGGGEQGSEVWTYDPFTARWALKEPNTSPPGICCGQQNVYDPVRGRYLRFPAFSLSHGWQWPREIYLNNDSVWSYDLETNTWRNMRPIPEPRVTGLRAACWDAHEEAVTIFGGEGSREGTLVYDPHLNTWTWKKPQPQPEFRSGGNMAYDAARKLHVLFGSQFGNDPHTWAFDAAKNEWRDLKPETLPPTDRNDAVLAYDSLHEVIVAIVKVGPDKGESAKHRIETWAFDAGRNEWRRMDPPQEPDAGGNRTRVLAFAPELGLTILENAIQIGQKREQQIWTYRYGDRKPAPVAPAPPRPRKEPRAVEDVEVSVLSTRDAVIRWKPVEGGVKGYAVERAVVEVWSEDQLTRLKTRTAPLEEPSVGAIRRIGAFRRITPEPVQGTSFLDKGLDLAKPSAVEGEPLYERKMHKDQLDPAGKPYRFAVHAYRVRAVGGEAESGPSPAVYTIPSAPQRFFAKEEGPVCHLKWEANPEMGIKGYRVYRMDGRYDKEPVSRLTPEPVDAPEYSDPAAGKKTRRYYVVAVDALGQEGHPSSPVWHEREWKKHYLPFTGEWHQ